MSGKIHDFAGGKGGPGDLNEEIERLESALAEARTAAGGQPGEGGSGELTAELREAKRKKQQVEEEYDRASERWRDERRRLNAEIDRLDRAFQKSQSDARRSKRSEDSSDEQLKSQVEEATMLRKQVEASLEKERSGWLAQKEELEAKIETLETSLVEAIERSNNRQRTEDAKERELSTEIETRTRKIQEQAAQDAESARNEAAKAQEAWEAEKGRLELEIHRLKERIATPPDETPSPAPEKPSRFSLTGQLRSRFGSKPAPADRTEDLADLRRQLTTVEMERDRLSDRMKELESQPGNAASAEKRIRDLEARLADATARLDSTTDVDEALLSEQRAWETERNRLESKIRSLEDGQRGEYQQRTQELEDSLIQSERRGTELAEQLDRATEKWAIERKNLEAQLATVDAASTGKKSSLKSATAKLKDALTASEQSRTDLDRQFESAREEWARESERLNANLEALRSELEQSLERSNDDDTEREALRARIKDLQQTTENADAGQLEAATAEWAEERRALEARIETLQSSLEDAEARGSQPGDDLGELSAELDSARLALKDTEQQLQAASDEWTSEREALERALGEAGEASTAIGVEKEGLARELETVRGELASIEEKRKAAAEWDSEREQLSAHIARLEEADGDPNKASKAKLAKLEAELTAAEKSKAAVEMKFDAAAAGWNAEREGLKTRIEELDAAIQARTSEQEGLRAEIQNSKETRNELEKRLQEAADERTTEREAEASRLDETQTQLALLTTERDGMTSRIQELESALDEARVAASGEVAERERIQADLNQALEARMALDERLLAAGADWNQEKEALTARITGLQSDLTAARRADADAGAHTQKLLSALEAAEQARDATEAKLQAAAEEWADDRNGLNDQIGELKSSLSVAESAQTEAKRHSQELESKHANEREQLQARVSDLERLLEEAHQAGVEAEARQQELEDQIQKFENAREQITQELETAQADASAERERLNGRIAKLETALEEAERAHVEAESQREALETRLGESTEQREALEAKLTAAFEESAARHETLNSTIESLQSDLEAARQSAESSQVRENELSAALEKAREAHAELESSAETASAERDTEIAELTERISGLESTLEETRQALTETESRRDHIQAELEAAQAERASSEAKLESLTVESNDVQERLGNTIRELQEALSSSHEGGAVADTERQQVEADLAEAQRARDALEKKLQSSSIEWENERERLNTNLRQLQSSRKKALDTDSSADPERLRLESELKEAKASLETVEQKFNAASVDWSTQRDTLSNTVRDLKVALKKAKEVKQGADGPDDKGGQGTFSKVLAWGRSRDRRKDGPIAVHTVAGLEARRQELEIRLDASEQARTELEEKYNQETDDWKRQRTGLEQRIQELEEARKKATSDGQKQLETLRQELTSKLEAALARLAELEAEAEKATSEWASQRTDLETQIAEWEQRVRQEIERVESETRSAVTVEFEKQIEALSARKATLERKAGIEGESASSVAEEIARIDTKIQEITQFIENPDSALSNVMRKSAERSELEAYRRGLSYLAADPGSPDG